MKGFVKRKQQQIMGKLVDEEGFDKKKKKENVVGFVVEDNGVVDGRTVLDLDEIVRASINKKKISDLGTKNGDDICIISSDDDDNHLDDGEHVVVEDNHTLQKGGIMVMDDDKIASKFGVNKENDAAGDVLTCPGPSAERRGYSEDAHSPNNTSMLKIHDKFFTNNKYTKHASNGGAAASRTKGRRALTDDNVYLLPPSIFL